MEVSEGIRRGRLLLDVSLVLQYVGQYGRYLGLVYNVWKYCSRLFHVSLGRLSKRFGRASMRFAPSFCFLLRV